jgi:prolipoprotein diacylglyceryltransferase
MLAAVLGLLLGGGLGFRLYILLVQHYEKVPSMANLIVVALVVLVGGCAIGGGYAGGLIAARLQRAQSAKTRTRRDQKKFVGKKKGKK